MGFFGELYLRSTRPFLSPRATDLECELIAQALGLSPQMRALDIGCGHARHLERLSERGLNVYGLDSDARSLADLAPAIRARVVRANLYAPPFRGCFDAAYSWYATLFISESEAENVDALRAAASTVRPGGRLLVHGHNPLVQAREPQSRFEETLEDGAHLVEETWFDLAANVLHGRRTLTEPGRMLEGNFLVRCPTLEDHARMASALDLRLEGTFGDVAGGPYSADSPDLIVRYRR
jgi:SAM-dependent methyltransferase